jgi:hypothetical protein
MIAAALVIALGIHDKALVPSPLVPPPVPLKLRTDRTTPVQRPAQPPPDIDAIVRSISKRDSTFLPPGTLFAIALALIFLGKGFSETARHSRTALAPRNLVTFPQRILAVLPRPRRGHRPRDRSNSVDGVRVPHKPSAVGPESDLAAGTFQGDGLVVAETAVPKRPLINIAPPPPRKSGSVSRYSIGQKPLDVPSGTQPSPRP